jgi:hypothetical protein
MQKLPADGSLANTGAIANYPLNFVSVARTYDELDMFYSGEY